VPIWTRAEASINAGSSFGAPIVPLMLVDGVRGSDLAPTIVCLNLPVGLGLALGNI
jgi:hypothetical protein